MKLHETAVVIRRSYRAHGPCVDENHSEHPGTCPTYSDFDPDFTVADLQDWLGPLFTVTVDDRLERLQLEYDYKMWCWDQEYESPEPWDPEMDKRAEALGVNFKDL